MNGDNAAADLIEDVASLVGDDRESHGDAVAQQEAAAEVWTWYLQQHNLLPLSKSLGGDDVARMMLLLKLSRGANGEYDIDHDRDAIGYAGIAGACAVSDGKADETELTRDGGNE
jgi:hypothetical protein